MKRIFPTVLILFLLASCNYAQQPTVTGRTPSVVPSYTATLPPTASLTPPTLTSTPVPCDPLIAEYCILDWGFLFQPPILPPDNDRVDTSYLYGSTQNGTRDPHHGVELLNAFGTPVYAAGDGVVVFADSDMSTMFSPWANFYGNVVIIRHQDDFYTLYAHLSSIFTSVGKEVQAGEKIGIVGQTGGATGSHLHFEVRRGSDYEDYFSTENPELWLIPQSGTGVLSITLKMEVEQNYELPLVVTRYENGNLDPLSAIYISSYAKGFEHNSEDAVLGSLPAGQYKVAFTNSSGLRERIVVVEAGKMTQVVFE